MLRVIRVIKRMVFMVCLPFDWYKVWGTGSERKLNPV